MVLEFITDFVGITSVIISTFIFGFVYQFILKNWSYFSDRGVKFVRGWPLLGTQYKMMLGMKAMAEDFRDVYEAFSNERFVGMYEMGGGPVYVIRDPELIKRITIKDFDHFINHRFTVHEDSDSLFGRAIFIIKDQRWKDMRSTLSPAFTGSKMRLMLSLVNEVSQSFIDFLKTDISVDKPKVFDIHDLFQRFASDTIASTAFGLQINSLEKRKNDFYETGRRVVNFDGLQGLKFFAFSAIPKIMNFFKVSFFTQKDTSYLRTLVKDNMTYRETNNIYRPDMIHLLMEAKKGVLQHSAKDEIEDLGFSTVQESITDNSAVKIQKWEDDDLVAQCMLFFLAGFNAVSSAHCFMAHELAVNPDVQEKLYQEIVEVQNQLAGKTVSYEILQKMKYMDMVVSETLRRWSLATANDRSVNKPYTMELENGTKVELKVGDGIWIPTYAIHLDPKYYPNPYKFDPERFSDENKHNIIPGTYLPFGDGPRNCIASRYALMQMKSLFFALLTSFELEKCDKTQHPIQLRRNTLNMEAEKGFWLQLKRRM